MSECAKRRAIDATDQTIVMMDMSSLKPNDPRVSYKTANVNGKTYSYILGMPPQGQQPIDTVFLCHGFPDMAWGWRCQIPVLMSLGFRVICPDMVGYAGSDAPKELEAYSGKSVAADVKELSAQIIGEGKQIILGGHDWGGQVVYRVALFYPELVKAVFSVCTPYVPPNPKWISLEDIVRTHLPQFSYQLQFAGPDVEKIVQGPEKIRQFLIAITGGKTQDGEYAIDVKSGGVDFKRLESMTKSPAMSDGDLDHYVSEYMKHEAPQLRGPLNWYRVRKINYDDEKKLLDERGPEASILNMPVLYIGATYDTALPPIMSKGMDAVVAEGKLTRGEVKATHWALWQAADDVNRIMGEWLGKVLERQLKPSL
ncbi:hypothetical protein NLU13_2946 [Sarocladium strictum]|uniref:AB hydrolase-1 domain-containing protein n=1 Tax=Sarocladium strictum TaxID=5046 RepID=A0AA39L9A2_SARSR|nr:hypothetical protein NLU13_2946 [Sarocladium strictum]